VGPKEVAVNLLATETVVRIESVPLISADQLLDALQAEGVEGSVVELEPLAVRVSGGDVGLLRSESSRRSTGSPDSQRVR
jgi:hypothetical protein